MADDRLGMDNVFADFRIIESKVQGKPDYPYLKMWFIDRDVYYKVNFKGLPLPDIVWKMAASKDLIGDMQKIVEQWKPLQAALYIIETFWQALNDMSQNWQAGFKVVKYKDKNTQ